MAVRSNFEENVPLPMLASVKVAVPVEVKPDELVIAPLVAFTVNVVLMVAACAPTQTSRATAKLANLRVIESFMLLHYNSGLDATPAVSGKYSAAPMFVGVSHETSAFAVTSIRRWWGQEGRRRYPNARHLLILADTRGATRPHAVPGRTTSNSFA